MFPVAGLGSRFLPATKASPKEMLPVVDKPLIQYAVEEAVAAGITEMIFVTGRNKRAIEDHFDKAYELETELERKARTSCSHMVQLGAARGRELHLHPPGRAARPGPRGAVRAAGGRRRAVRGDPRRRPDRRAAAGDGAMARDLRARAALAARRAGGAARPDAELRHRHHRPDAGRHGAHPQHRREAQAGGGAVEPRGDRPLRPHAAHLRSARAGDARAPAARSSSPTRIAALLREERVLACDFHGRRYDCGSKLGYLQATVEFGLRHPEIGPDFTTLPEEPLDCGRRSPDPRESSRPGAPAASSRTRTALPARRRSQAAIRRVAAEIERRLSTQLSAGARGHGRRGGVRRAAAAAAALSARLRLHPRHALRRGHARRARSTGGSRRRRLRAAAAPCWCSTTSSTTATPWPRSATGCSSSARASSTARCWSRRSWRTKKPIAADFVGLTHPRPLRVRLRHGREGLLAQPARDPRAEGVTMPMLAIIGGSGLTQLGNLEVTAAPGRAHAVRRALGRAHLRPHRAGATWCSSRATATATPSRRTRSTTAPTSGRCKDAGADCVVSVASVGGIRADIAPGHARAARPDHRLHLGPRARPTSKARGVPVNHIDFTEPYSRAAAQAASSQAAKRLRRARSLDGGVYAATQGPRLETAAEIDRLERDGARHGRHDRHARGRARARARASTTPPSRWSPTTPRAAATARAPCRSTRSARSLRRRPWCRVRQHHREALRDSMIRDVLRMGDPRLLAKVSSRSRQFDTPELHALLQDMRDTMAHLNGAGLAAPQIGVLLRVVIFGVHANPRYPDVERGARHGAHQPGHHAAFRRDGGGLGRLPLGSRHARPRSALHAAALSRLRRERQSRSSAT